MVDIVATKARGTWGGSVSVALCTHNGAAYLGEQVRSICAQTLLPDEIIISDDASTDDTLVLAEAAVAEAAQCGRPRLRVLRNLEPLGVARNFAQAIAACTGDFIALSDQDDRWQPERLASMLDEFGRRPELLLLHSDARLIDAQGEPVGKGLFHALAVQPFELEWLHGGRAFDVYLRRNLATGATTVFRRRLLDAALPMPDGWLHDEWLAAIASSVGDADALELPLVDYRQHGRNMIGARRLTWLEEMRRAFAPRGRTHVERAHKAQAWLKRLEELRAKGVQVFAARIEALRLRWMHQQFRAALPASRVKRALPVLQEMRTGNYDRFGRGLRGVLRDLLEPV